MLKLPGLKSLIPSTDILYLAGNGNYTWVYLADGRRELTCRTLSCHIPLLADFVRIHKAYLVNPAYVQTVERIGRESAVVSMQDTTKLPISRRRIGEVHRTLLGESPGWTSPNRELRM